MVVVSHDGGETWTSPPRAPSGILVVVPSAGTQQNAEAFHALSSQHTVRYAAMGTRDGGYKYPPGWHDMMTVPVDADCTDSLMGLARAIIADIQQGYTPALVVVESRGGQVVLPMLLRCA